MCKISAPKYDVVNLEITSILDSFTRAQEVVERAAVDVEIENLCSDGEEDDEVFEQLQNGSPVRPSSPTPSASHPTTPPTSSTASVPLSSSISKPPVARNLIPDQQSSASSDSSNPKTVHMPPSSDIAASEVQSTRKRSSSVDDVQLDATTAQSEAEKTVKRTRYEASRDCKVVLLASHTVQITPPMVEPVPSSFFDMINDPESSYICLSQTLSEAGFFKSDSNSEIAEEDISVNLLAVQSTSSSSSPLSTSAIAIHSSQPSTSSKHAAEKTPILAQDQPIVQASRSSVIVRRLPRPSSVQAPLSPPPLCHSTPIPPQEQDSAPSSRASTPASPVRVSPIPPPAPPPSPAPSSPVEPDSSSSSSGFELPPNPVVFQPANPWIDGGYGNMIGDAFSFSSSSTGDSGVKGSSHINYALDYDQHTESIENFDLSMFEQYNIY